MKKQTVEVFHALMKKGWIDRSETAELWKFCEDPDVQEELETLGEGLGFETIRSGDRMYLVPTQDNDLFLKNNIDFRRDIRDSEAKTRTLHLMNYLSVYLLYLFYHGEGTDPKCREFISKADAIRAFSDHCRICVERADNTEQTEYSYSFIQLAEDWLQKTDGTAESMKSTERYGIVNRLLVKFNAEHDDLFYQEGDNIRPTRKLDNLMPYFLRKERIEEMQKWIHEVNNNATNHENQDCEFPV